ncbi:MAG: twin-arginine translocation signal domain-containing protein, partial [Tannerella sp.]|nr:twin-arginine translocation signal domain-containing protein [Tannerella sp.]
MITRRDFLRTTAVAA